MFSDKVKNLDAEAQEMAQSVREMLDKGGHDLEALARLFIRVRDTHEILKTATSEMQKLFDLIRINKIPDMMDEQGITTITYDGIGRLTLTSDLRAAIPKPQREAAYKWLEEHGYGDLVTEMINPSTLKAFCKRRIKDGEVVPDDLFRVTPFSRASITKV